MEDNERKAMRDIAVQQEREDVERIAAKDLEAKFVKQQQKNEQLAHFKSVWDAQKSLKKLNEQTEAEF